MIKFINFHESLALEGYLCVTLLCERKGKEHGRELYLSLCNREWLKVVWILMFFPVGSNHKRFTCVVNNRQ
jgi:hypothetical protein